jgi:hypothetical protein
MDWTNPHVIQQDHKLVYLRITRLDVSRDRFDTRPRSLKADLNIHMRNGISMLLPKTDD